MREPVSTAVIYKNPNQQELVELEDGVDYSVNQPKEGTSSQCSDEHIAELSQLKQRLKNLLVEIDSARAVEKDNVWSGCTVMKCFNFTRCPLHSTPLIFVYTEHLDSQLLSQWKQALRSLPSLTNEPEQACLFVAINSAEDFRPHKLDHWTLSPSNHIIVDIADNVSAPLLNSSAILAHSRPTFIRPDQDVLISDITFQLLKQLPPLLNFPTKILAVFAAQPPQSLEPQELKHVEILKRLGDGDSEFLMKTSCGTERCSLSQWCICSLTELKDLSATFVILPNRESVPDRQLTLSIHAALTQSRIPVLWGDYHPLPLSEVIPWPKAILRLPDGRLSEVKDFLTGISPQQLFGYLKQGRIILQNHFRDVGQTMRGVINTVYKRIGLPPLPPGGSAALQPTIVYEHFPHRNESYDPELPTHGSEGTPWDTNLPFDARFRGECYRSGYASSLTGGLPGVSYWFYWLLSKMAQDKLYGLVCELYP